MDKKWEKQNPLIFLIPGSTFPRLLRIRSKDLEAEITEIFINSQVGWHQIAVFVLFFHLYPHQKQLS